jgi:RNA polymerase sigma factor (sigma-70 family)
MKSGPLPAVLEHLRKWASPEGVVLSDAELLARFAAGREEAAFAALMRRHGRMVWSVCRHVLGHEQDAEDAFQATFLVLARKAGSIRKGMAIASWLHATAYHIATRARRNAAIRRARESKGESMSVAQPISESAWREVLAILEEEVQRLSERQRAAFVLCSLEGKSLAEAARQLGWKEGTLSGTLSRAREQLGRRLARRGVTLTTVLAGLAVSAESAAPAALIEKTFRAALAFAAGQSILGGVSPPLASLVREATRSLVVTKLRVLAVVLTAAVAAGGVAGFVGQKPESKQEASAEPAARRAEQPKSETAPRERTDHFGDPLPPSALARIGTVRWWCGYTHGPLVFAPDGKHLVLRDNRGVVPILDTATGAALHRIESINDKGWSCFALAPNGQTVATAGAGRSVIQLWDARTGKEFRQIDGDKLGASTVAFSPDGKTFAAGMFDTSLRLWDTTTWKEIRRFAGKDSDYRNGIVFLPDGKTLISSDLDSIRWRDIATGHEVRRIVSKKDGKPGTFDSFAVSPDGKRVAAIHSPQTLFLWDATTGKEIQRVELGSDRITSCLCFSPDSQTLAWGGVGRRGKQTMFFAAATGRELRRWDEGDDAIDQLAFSPDGRMVAQVKSGVIRLRDAKTGKPVVPSRGLPNYVMGVRFSRDGKSLITSCFGGRTGSWNPVTGEPLTSLRDPPEGFGRHLDMLLGAALTAHGERAALVNTKGVLHVWEPATGKVCCRIDEPPVREEAAHFSADGKALVIVHKDGVVRLWDATTGKLLRDFPRTKDVDLPRPCVLSPDGRILATDSADDQEKTIRLWDTATGNEQGRLAWQEDILSMPSCFAFSLDGKCLLAAHGYNENLLEGDVADLRIENSLCLWNLAGKRMLYRLSLPPGEVQEMALSPDGKTVAAAAYDTIILFELASGKERGRFTGHRDSIWSLAFSPNGRRLASGSLDHTACVWDVTGICADGQWSPRRVQQDELERLWADLGNKDGVRAYRALWRFAAAGSSSVAFLAQQLRPVPRVKDERLTRLLADLDSDRFETRERAARELQRLGEQAEPALRKALASKPSLEASRRLRALLDQVESRTLSAEQLHALRAVEVLEHVGTAEARTVLRSLAAGAPADCLTREAKMSLQRLSGPTVLEP